MLLDLRAMDDSVELSSEVCIVGAGAAGISLARRLAMQGVDVLLLESGGPDHENDVQDLLDNASLDLRIDHREVDLDAPIEVPRHPVRTAQIQIGIPSVLEVEHARVFQELVHDTHDADALGHSRQSWTETANPTNDEIDLDSRLREMRRHDCGSR